VSAVQIDTRTIGEGHPTYVIAEIGSNHDGNLDTAKRLIETASRCGADAAKFQLYREHELYPGESTPGALPDAWLPELQQTCRDQGVEFLCSVFSLETLAAYLAVGPAAVKIASPESHDQQLLRAAGESGLPLIIATGASDNSDVTRAVLAARTQKLILLHCVSAYPSKPEHMNLACIPRMADRYRVPVGLSDHSLERIVPEYAVAAGACVIEKHLTPDPSLPGPDHPFALGPADFRAMVRAIRRVESVMGDGVKRVQPSEDASDRRATA
jgi:sialic acid synthase SpsE